VSGSGRYTFLSRPQPPRNAKGNQVSRHNLGRIPQFSRRATHDDAIERRESPLPSKVVLPMLDLHMEAAIHL